MIDGVVLKELITHTDERGFFCEIVRVTDEFDITSHTSDPADEGRIPHDDPEFGHDRTAGPPIK